MACLYQSLCSYLLDCSVKGEVTVILLDKGKRERERNRKGEKDRGREKMNPKRHTLTFRSNRCLQMGNKISSCSSWNESSAHETAGGLSVTKWH